MKALLFLVLALGLQSTSAASRELPKTVLVVDSNTQNTPYFVDVHAAFNTALNSISDKSVYVYTESLDLRHFNSPEYLNRLSEFFREKYRDKPIGVIVTYSTLSLSFVLQWRDKTWPGVPVVFVNVGERTIARFKLPADVTGLTGRYRLEDMVGVAQTLIPNLRGVALVGDKLGTPGLWEHFTEDVPEIEKRLAVDDLTGLPMADVRRRVSALSKDTAIIYFGLFTDGNNVSFIPKVALTLIAETANRPIIVDADVLIGTGATGGLVTVGKKIGSEAAQLAWRVLGGQNISELPVRNGDFRTPIFDWRQLQRWGLSTDNLPIGSEIRFRQPTAWEQYRWQIIMIALVLLTQTLLIAALILERRRRQGAELEARHRMDELTLLDRRATAGEMSASIAHEINQPLAAIVASGNAGLRWLSNNAPNIQEVADSLKRIVSDGHRASKIIDTVRSMYRKDEQTRAPLDVNKLVRDVLALLRVELDENNISVRTALSDHLPAVSANQAQLQQVILNLIRNAIDAMASVTNQPRVLHVRSARAEPNKVAITIEDSGPGLDEVALDRIFEPFFTSKPKGMGMGLSICKTIVEAHGGLISAIRGRSTGAEFRIDLPSIA